ncbi:unnamed protein product [Linum tenue]|uniref:Cystatin domain-containing protein n=1 Tax=Linum tenue TaxID=586396 RepID=A0AAV0GQH6_9ROSI|nr:unnamed protein product [Linum tenue]
MDSNLTTPIFGHELLATDANPDLSMSDVKSAPGSGSSSSKTDLGPEPKKQKTMDEATDDVQVTEEDDGDTDTDMEESEEEESTSIKVARKPLVLFPSDEEGMEKLRRFHKEVIESEGFDFTEFPPVDCIVHGVSPVNLKNDYSFNNVRECVDHVVNQVNEADIKELKLEAGDILRANRVAVAGSNYYITFKATNVLCADPKDAEKVYQAQVYLDFLGNCETHLLRLKGQKEAIIEDPRRPKPLM